MWCLALVVSPGRAFAEAGASRRVALVIGNARYESEVGPLRNTVNDARAMAKTLRLLQFEVIEKHNVTRDELLGAMMKFREKLADAEVALFYFAGHGISVAGSNYLIPIKSRYSPDGDQVTTRMLAETKLFNAEQAVAEMSAAGARCNLVVLDACRNTPVARNPRLRDAAGTGGLSEMKPPAGSLIAFATDAGRTANDGDGTNGLYTDELLKHLRRPGLTIEQVFKRTRAGVLERSGGAQIPAEYSRLVGDDIFLAGTNVPDPVDEPVPKGRPIPLPSLSEINKLAESGDASGCVEGLRRVVRVRGPGGYAVSPLETLVEIAKENLRGAVAVTPKVESALKSCDLVLSVIDDALPASHPERARLAAKAHNRRGDALLLKGEPAAALDALNAAARLTPTDAYVLYNRGRAFLALGKTEEASGDFRSAASGKFAQPGARKLALAALAALDSSQPAR